MRPVSGPYSGLKLVPLLMGPLWYMAGGGVEERSSSTDDVRKTPKSKAQGKDAELSIEGLETPAYLGAKTSAKGLRVLLGYDPLFIYLNRIPQLLAIPKASVGWKKWLTRMSA